MSRRNIIIIIVVILLLVIGGWVWWFLSQRSPIELGPSQNPVNEPQKLPDQTNTNTATSPIGEPQVEATIKTVANIFAERFGSFSNQTNFENLKELKSLMTVKMQSWADAQIAAGQDGDSSSYYGVTTTALSSQTIDFDQDSGRATINVSTQRSETKGSTANPRIFYQTLELKLTQTAAGWKVDEATWL